jgi:O-antigen ligase/polysaccharide polymerase Wzy-like membrane protein
LAWHPSEHEHAVALIVAGVVAVAYAGAALAEGGYGSEFRAVFSIAVWALVIVGLAFGLWPRAATPGPALAAGLALGGFTALTGLSMLWASDDGRVLAEFVRSAGYLGLFACIVLGTRRGSARTWLGGLAIGVTGVCLLALASRLVPGPFPAQDLTQAIPDARGRLSYPFEYWNALGAVCAVGILLLAWLGAAAAKRWARALCCSLLPALGLTLILTGSRGGVASLAVGLVILVAADRRRVQIAGGLLLGMAGAAILAVTAVVSPELLDGLVETEAARSQGLLLLAVTAAVCAVVGAGRWVADARLSRLRVPGPPRWAVITALVAALAAFLVLADPLHRIDQFATPPSASSSGRALTIEHLASAGGSGRFQYWSVALQAFESRPLTGIGAGGFEAWWGQHGTINLFVRNAHSLFVESLAELGILGLLLICSFLGAPAASGLRRLRDEIPDSALAPALAVLGAGVLTAAIEWTWELPAAFAPTAIAAGLLAGPALASPATPGRTRTGFGVLALMAGWLAILAAAAVLFTVVKINQSQDAVGEGDLDGALLAAREARALQPWAAAPRLQEALVQEVRGDVPGARMAIDQALARAPEDWQVWFVDARIRAAEGDIAGSLWSTEQTNRLRPEFPFLAQNGGS